MAKQSHITKPHFRTFLVGAKATCPTNYNLDLISFKINTDKTFWVSESVSGEGQSNSGHWLRWKLLQRAD